MNDTQIESLLRHPSRLVAPAGLKARLLAAIQLPQAVASPNRRAGVSITPIFWRRWFPALSFGMLFLGCFMVVAWQASQWVVLRNENRSLRTGISSQEELRAEQTALKSRLATAGQTENAAREQEELTRLQGEVAQLNARAQEVSLLRSENKRLKAEMAAAIAKAGLEPEADPFAEAQGRAARVSCVNNMKQIGLALRMWANDNKDVFPMDFLSASNEMNTPKILTCAGDAGRVRANNWQEFNGSSVSYEFLSPGGNEMEPQVVLTRCPIHNNVGLCDGSVQMLGTNQHVERVDGKWKIVRIPEP